MLIGSSLHPISIAFDFHRLGVIPSGHTKAGTSETMREPTGATPQIFNNADSFAQAFDAAWKEHDLQQPDHGLDRDAKLAHVLEQVADHPFRVASPELAEAVARFRLRLLGL